MNKTKKITQGAMMLAIYGALVLIDRITAFWFTELVVLIAPIIIIMYSSMQSLKDGIFLSIGVIIMGFLLGNFNTTYLIYVPVGIVTAMAYSLGIYKNLDKRTLLFISVSVYVVGEVLAYYFIYPLLGFPVSQMIAEYKLVMQSASKTSGFNYMEMFSKVGLDFDKMIVIIYCISTILMGAMEGLIIHILSIFLLKRFKIKDLGTVNLWESKPNKVVAYISMGAMSLLYLKDFITNETAYYIAITIALFGCLILLYYGYVFLVLYGSIVLHKNVAVFFVLIALFAPLVLIVLMILGFLYAAGPLRLYLERKIDLNIKAKNKQNNE